MVSTAPSIFSRSISTSSSTCASMRSLKKAAVLYHYPCPDGAFAALAAHLYFSASALPVAFFPNTVYDPIRPESLPLDELSDVYLLDFAGPSGFVAELSSRVESVTILDHHKTALESLGGDASNARNLSKVIDMGRSGATIAFDFFREKLLGNIRAPRVEGDGDADCRNDFVLKDNSERVRRLFKYIEDGDLWRWELPDSKAFSSGLKDLNIEYNVNINPTLFDQLLALDPELIISRGQETLSEKQNLIDKVLEHSYEIELGGEQFGRCLPNVTPVGLKLREEVDASFYDPETCIKAVDADSISNLRSELGNQLADKSLKLNLRAIGAVVYRVAELNNNQILKISLRSLGSEDTTPISQKYGGGGHRNASSFMLSSMEFEKWKV